jgi:predicted RNA-binding protein Jag
MEQQIKIIKFLLETILEKLTVKGEVEILEDTECPQFIIRTEEAGVLIGENGQHLVALNHLLKKISENEFKKQNLEVTRFFLDINYYQTKKNEELKKFCADVLETYEKHDINGHIVWEK